MVSNTLPRSAGTTTVEQRNQIVRTAPTKPPKFSAASSEGLGLNYFLEMSVLLVGLGTHGCLIVRQVIDLLYTELGDVPDSVKYLLLDCKAMPFDRHRRHSLPLGIDGAGTNPHEGRRRFDQYFRVIKDQLMRRVADLSRASGADLVPALPPRKAIAIVNVATGFGGSSGGLFHPMISLEHHCAQQRNIENPRVHALVVSPQVLLKDTTKEIKRERQALILNTYAENVGRVLGEAQLPGTVHEQLPDGTSVSVKASDRVFSLHKAGQTNGWADLSTSEELAAVVADTLFLYLFTSAGHFLDQRMCDIFETQRLLG